MKGRGISVYLSYQEVASMKSGRTVRSSRGWNARSRWGWVSRTLPNHWITCLSERLSSNSGHYRRRLHPSDPSSLYMLKLTLIDISMEKLLSFSNQAIVSKSEFSSQQA